jgi:site-specific DNA-methyltransferase (adenine-specific)
MLILNEDAGITHSQLADLLNSKIINFIFQKIFNTHKVLRGDLEQLPIHKDYFLQQTRFTEDSYLRYLQLELKDGKYRKM